MSIRGRHLNKPEVLKRTAVDLVRKGIGCVIQDNAIIIKLGKYRGQILGRARLTWLHGKREWIVSYPFPSPDPRRVRCDDYEIALLEIIAIQIAARAEIERLREGESDEQ